MMEDPVNTLFLNDAGNLCQDPDTKGFDLQTGETWIYPTNYPIRDYQYNITQEALHKNTLVSLPTGLGKTFIAAVVMYNYYRWYPHGKIIFMAPTRPLVKQQIDACYNVTAIPQEVTAELTGSKLASSRTEIWQAKRVFFITPQVLQNDIENVPGLAEKIKCLIFDEAHKAKGNHAYCDVIRKLVPKNKLFRVLGLSATPGNSVKDILEVIQNLLISHLEFKTEDSLDVKSYVFERNLETVVVPLGDKLQQVREEYIQILEKYTKVLMNYKVIHGNCANLTKGKMFMVLKEFQAKNTAGSTPNYNEIVKSLHISVTLYHAYELLTRHGLRSFLNFFEEHINDPMLRNVVSIREIMEDVQAHLGPDPSNISQLPDGNFADISSDTKFGHPKFYHLRDILMDHFKSCGESSRVIVFFEYRGSVKEAFALLIQSRPLVRPKIFLGQGSGITQKTQISVVKAFREGVCNTLLSTCIGEEGLDVGDVDLIVCFDVSNKSPIRMIQRMGRTGRKKQGRIIVLVTEGKEQQILKECLVCKSNLGTFVLNSKQLTTGMYPDNPAMIPSYIKPKCQKMHISVKKPVLPKKNSNIKDMLRYMSRDSPRLDDVEIIEIEEKLNLKPQLLCKQDNSRITAETGAPNIYFSNNLERLRSYQPCGKVKHSKQCEILVSLLQFADSKRFNIPITQNFGAVKNLKQGDIRHMFGGQFSSSEESSLPLTSSQFELFDKDILKSFPPEFFTELSNYLSIQLSQEHSCKVCTNFFECFNYNNSSLEMTDALTNLRNWVQPSESIVDNITERDWQIFIESCDPNSADLFERFQENSDVFDNFQFTQLEKQGEISLLEEKSFAYQVPKSFTKILDSFKITEQITSTLKTQQSVNNDNMTTVKDNASAQTKIINSYKPQNLNNKDVLLFFKFENAADLFVVNKPLAVPDLDSTQIYSPKITSPSAVAPKIASQISPDLFDVSPDMLASPPENNKEDSISNVDSGSPILCTYDRLQALKSKAKRKLFDKTLQDPCNKPNLSILKQTHKSFLDCTNHQSNTTNFKNSSTESLKESEKSKPMSPIKEVTETPPQPRGPCLDFVTIRKKPRTVATNTPKAESVSVLDDISNLCDLSQFGLSNRNVAAKEDQKKPPSRLAKIELMIDDLDDLSCFGISAKSNEKPNADQNQKDKSNQTQTKEISPIRTNNDLDITNICDIDTFISKIIPKVTELSKTYVDSDGSNKEGEIKMTREENNKDEITYNGNTNEQKDKTVKVKIPVTESQMLSYEKSQNENHFDRSDGKNVTKNKNNENTNEQKDKETTIDLTDSPVKERISATPSQMSVTQMLNYMKNKTSSQNEIAIFQTPQSTNKKRAILSLKHSQTPKISPVQSSKKNEGTSTTLSSSKTKQCLFNISLSADNSDDEFEDVSSKPVTSVHSSTKRKKLVKNMKKSNTIKANKKLFCEFLDQEAVLADEEGVVVSEDEEDSGEDCYDPSFLGDETQGVPNTQMHAFYLKSIRSPPNAKFKVPEPRHHVANVFSQEVSNLDDTYSDDSFCVNNEDIEVPDPHDLSELEVLEAKLKAKKKSKKRKKSDNDANSGSKRKRVIVMSDDSD